MRRELGLPPLRGNLSRGATQADLNLGIWSPLLRGPLEAWAARGAAGEFSSPQALVRALVPPGGSPAQAAARCRAAVLIGPDGTGALAQLPPRLPVLRARLRPGPEAALLAGQPVYAFCGIANPSKFFATLQEAGAVLAGRMAFNDHYPFDAGDLEQLLAEAEAMRAIPVTTRKDIVRIPPQYRARITVVTVALEWEDSTAIEALLDALAQRVPVPA
jgi:tetraacyldisaccharide 4'-kinase